MEIFLAFLLLAFTFIFIYWTLDMDAGLDADPREGQKPADDLAGGEDA